MLRPGLLSPLTGLSLAEGGDTESRLIEQVWVLRRFLQIDNSAVPAR